MTSCTLRRSAIPAAANFIVIVLLAAASYVGQSTQPTQAVREPATVELAACLDGPMRTTHRPTLRLSCRSGGGPWKGAAGGRGAGSAVSGGAWTRDRTYGNPGRGDTRVEGKSMGRIKKLAKRHKVPWPNPYSWKAISDFRPYGVYNIFVKTPHGVKVFKDGITSRGAVRPRSQIRTCNQWARANIGPRANCAWAWTRQDVHGFLKARRIEAGHATKYKHRHGHCPPGMRKCL